MDLGVVRSISDASFLAFCSVVVQTVVPLFYHLSLLYSLVYLHILHWLLFAYLLTHLLSVIFYERNDPTTPLFLTVSDYTQELI